MIIRSPVHATTLKKEFGVDGWSYCLSSYRPNQIKSPRKVCCLSALYCASLHANAMRRLFVRSRTSHTLVVLLSHHHLSRASLRARMHDWPAPTTHAHTVLLLRCIARPCGPALSARCGTRLGPAEFRQCRGQCQVRRVNVAGFISTTETKNPACMAIGS